MKALHFALVVFALVLTSSAFGQDDRPLPIPQDTPMHTIHAYPYMYRNLEQAPASVTLALPNYSYSVVSPVDGKTYTGQIIGALGQTGLATGPHVHFEVQVDGTSVDPVTWLAS